jgi:hypothetical protein
MARHRTGPQPTTRASIPAPTTSTTSAANAISCHGSCHTRAGPATQRPAGGAAPRQGPRRPSSRTRTAESLDVAPVAGRRALRFDSSRPPRAGGSTATRPRWVHPWPLPTSARSPRFQPTSSQQDRRPQRSSAAASRGCRASPTVPTLPARFVLGEKSGRADQGHLKIQHPARLAGLAQAEGRGTTRRRSAVLTASRR